MFLCSMSHLNSHFFWGMENITLLRNYSFEISFPPPHKPTMTLFDSLVKINTKKKRKTLYQH